MGAVEQEGGARRREPQHVLSLNKLELVAGDKIRLSNQIRGVDWPWPEAQVRNRLGPGFV